MIGSVEDGAAVVLALVVLQVAQQRSRYADEETVVGVIRDGRPGKGHVPGAEAAGEIETQVGDLAGLEVVSGAHFHFPFLGKGQGTAQGERIGLGRRF